jgi:hypothetical protein
MPVTIRASASVTEDCGRLWGALIPLPLLNPRHHPPPLCEWRTEDREIPELRRVKSEFAENHRAH